MLTLELASVTNNEQINVADEQINEQINASGEQINVADEQINEQINDRQTTVLDVIRSNPNTTYDELSRAVGVSSSTVRRDVDALVADGLLKRIGSRKTGHWEVQGGAR